MQKKIYTTSELFLFLGTSIATFFIIQFTLRIWKKNVRKSETEYKSASSSVTIT